MRSNKRVERPSQPKLYSLVNSSAFVELLFLKFTICETKRKKWKSIRASWKFTMCIVRWHFVFVPVFCIWWKLQKQGRKSIKTLSVFLPLKWEALEMGPGCSVSGNKYFTAGNADKHWAATVLYLMAIFQFLKNLLPEEVHSSQISWYFNRHNIINIINGINVFRNDKLGNSCSVDEYWKMLGSSFFFRECTQWGCVSSTLIALIAIKILRRRMKCFRDGPFWRLASSWGRLSKVSSMVCSGQPHTVTTVTT